MTSSPHDALFRFTFSQPEHAAPLIRSNLPAGLARRIDWSTLALQPGSFVDPELSMRHDALVAVMSYALAVTDVAPDALKRTMALHAGRPGEEAAMTAAERIAEEARKAVLAAAEEARKQALAQGRAAIVLKQLSLRFGPLPESAVQRIQSVSIAELDALAERVLSAKSLDEALG